MYGLRRQRGLASLNPNKNRHSYITGGPVLLVAFDDSSATVYKQAFPIMSAAGIKGTFYFIGKSIKTHLTNLQTMYSFGWDIANHTMTHPILTSLSQAGIESEITNCQQGLDLGGLPRASRHVSYPGGYYNDTALAAMANLDALTGRTTVQGVKNVLPLASPYEINVDLNFGNTVTLQDAKDWVDEIIGENGVGMSLFHQLVVSPSTSTEWGIADFGAWIDYIVEKQLITLTISELYALSANGRLKVNLPYII